MKYLLIDFGATFIKCAVYNTASGEYKRGEDITSPFSTTDKITKQQLLNLLSDIILSYTNINGVLICTILGGCYIGDVYISWKSPDCKKSDKCMISGLLGSNPHIQHKPFTTSNSYLNKLEVSGYINSVPIYCALGDTDCVIKSIDLNSNTVAVNMGTGSQVITLDRIERFFPCGRMLLTYENFFREFGVSMFSMFDNITLTDVINSSLSLDLNIFNQSRNYSGGGNIGNIHECNLTLTNLLGSIIKHLVIQYKPFIENFDNILLLGGVAKKIKVLPAVFEFFYPHSNVLLVETEIESTHKGLIRFIKDEL